MLEVGDSLYLGKGCASQCEPVVKESEKKPENPEPGVNTVGKYLF